MDHSTDKEWKNNQSKADLERLKKEDEFIKSVPPRQLVNEFPLYIDRQNLVRYITLNICIIKIAYTLVFLIFFMNAWKALKCVKAYNLSINIAWFILG